MHEMEESTEHLSKATIIILFSLKGVLLEYPTTTVFQWGHLKNGPYTYTVSGGDGRVF